MFQYYTKKWYDIISKNYRGMKMTSKQKVFKYLGIVGNVFFYLLLLVLLLFSISNLSIQNERDLPNIFGKGFVSILSGSMDGENQDNFPTGSLVFIDILNNDQKDSLEPGQIVVFFDTNQKIHIIHRIKTIEGDLVITQGDVNANTYGHYNGENINANMQLEINHKDQIIGRYTGHFTGVGTFIQEVRSPNGFLLWIVLPLLLLFGFEVVVFVRFLLQRNKSKLEAKHEAEKEKLRLEIQKEMEAQNKK